MIDGVGIIDSDFAHDIYNLVMEMYHSGESIENIRNSVNELPSTCCEVDYEIFTTAYALAMWEIGELTNEQLQSIKEIVEKGASSQWSNIHPNAQKVRQRVLNKFLQKIEQPNLKIKKRKKYKKIKFLFSKGEILAIKINNRYRCVIFDTLYQYKNDAYYSFVVTTYNSDIQPTAENILAEEIPVTKKTNTGQYGIRTLNIYFKFVEQHKTNFLKSGIITMDPQAINLGFSRYVSGFDDLQDMEKEMDNILLGEKAELYVCYLL